MHSRSIGTVLALVLATGALVVGVLLADRVFVDRPTASAVLNELVPAVVTSLTSAQEAGQTAEF
ncbi:MAG: hypothetical protein M3431_10940 [Actinomycetota bacterium]|nr:hypothetical protein [Actinomycetota bacterium]